MCQRKTGGVGGNGRDAGRLRLSCAQVRGVTQKREGWQGTKGRISVSGAHNEVQLHAGSLTV